MKETLQFLVMVEAQQSREELLEHILSCFSDAVRKKSNSCDLRGNWIELWPNEDYDPDLIDDPEDGFLSFRWRLEATPLGDRVDEAEQVERARELVACLHRLNCRCVVCANFEDQLRE